jgi:hypothetical protein
MKTLPRYISRHHSGAFDVRVERLGVEYRARVATLARAVQVRDQFLAAAGPGRTSNTGLTGISETVHWGRNVRQPIFAVCVNRHTTRKFYLSKYGGRRAALTAAAAFRSRLTGQPITPQQIEEALNHV